MSIGQIRSRGTDIENKSGLEKGLHTARRWLRRRPDAVFPLRPPLPLPAGVSEQQLFDFVTSVRVQDAPEAEMRAYGGNDFRRFVYTWSLGSGTTGKCLELGGNPYFTSMLLRKFSDLDLHIANYFSPEYDGGCEQRVDYRDLTSGERRASVSPSSISISKKTPFPMPTGNSMS